MATNGAVPRNAKEREGGDYGPTSRENMGPFFNSTGHQGFSWGHHFVFSVLFHKCAD